MSHSGKIQLRHKAIELRKKGFSMREIQKQLSVSKSSVSRWVQEIQLTEKQILRLYASKKTGSLKGSYIASQNKIKIKKLAIEQSLHDGRKEIGPLSSRDKFIAGVALYFGEGDKTDKSVGFTNGNPQAVSFMCQWLREFCHVTPTKFRANLYIHDNLDEIDAKKFWSKLSSIPISQFTKSQIVANNPSRYRKSILPRGVIRIVVNDISLHRKIMGWISGVFEI
ncbi:helix-turn-helix domain-containing protein [Candidatus Woesebacteria bacterium]|nr:helix-turn-helix domain-containing protein [Candidatus Woesebacteria bacterium]